MVYLLGHHSKRKQAKGGKIDEEEEYEMGTDDDVPDVREPPAPMDIGIPAVTEAAPPSALPGSAAAGSNNAQ